jgi:hypothetical protein
LSTGFGTQLTKQAGEYLVAAEVCRHGYLATTFTGSVPHYDIIASNSTGKHQAIQVKAIKGANWQFDARVFAEVRLDGQRQVVGPPTPAPYPDLVCVFVRLREPGTDEFYVLMWEDLQRIAIAAHGHYLESHGGIRPKKHDSFHVALRPEMLQKHRDGWGVLDRRLQ